MKILFVISTLRFGGAERVMSVLSSYFANSHEVWLVRFENNEPFYKLNEKIKLINLDLNSENKGFTSKVKKRFFKIIALRELIKNNNFDCVVSFMDSTNLLSIIANFGLKTPLVISEHSHFTLLNKKWRLLKRIFYPLANGLSVLTNDDLKYYDYVKNKAVIYNPVMIENQEIKKENLIIFVGRLVKIKGCDLFLRALSLVDLKDFKIEVLGDGQERENLENLAKELNLNVTFKGSIKDISSYYSKAKIIVLSSFNEGFGNVLVESIYFDCIRVATPTPGAKELIKDEFDGFISDDFNPNSLAKKIELAMEQNPQITQNARLKQDEFQIQNIYQKWLNLIQEAKK